MDSRVLGLIAAGCLLSACGDIDVTREVADSTPPQVTASVDTELPAVLPVPTIDPRTSSTARREGLAAFERGDYAEASQKLEIAIAGRPDDAFGSYLLGLSSFKNGDFERAESAFESSLSIDATRPKTWINLARVRMDRKNAKGALEAATKALEIDPTSAVALHQEGRALLALGRADEAEASLLAARGFSPDDGYVANTLGLLLIQRGRHADAVEHLEAAKAALPHVSYVRNNLGVAYERTGRRGEALVEYQAAVDAGDTGNALRSLNRLGPGPVESAAAVAASN